MQDSVAKNRAWNRERCSSPFYPVLPLEGIPMTDSLNKHMHRSTALQQYE